MRGLPRRREGAKAWKENDVAREIVDAALQIHKELVPGLLESAYGVLPADKQKRRGLDVERQVAVPITFRGRHFTEGFRADLLVCVELKSVEKLVPSDPKQLRAYLRLLGFKLGLLINFNAPLLKAGIVRIVNGLEDDPYPKYLRAFAPPRED